MHLLDKDTMAGIGYIMIVHLGAAFLLGIIRYLSDENTFHSVQLVFFYSFGPLVMMLPLVILQKWSLKTPCSKIYILRGIGEFGGWAASFFALTLITLPMQTALSFTVPLFAIPLSIMLLKERAGSHVWISLIMGFIGVLIVTRFAGFAGEAVLGASTLNEGVLYMLFASLLFAGCTNCIRALAMRKEPAGRIMFYMYAYTSLFTLLFIATDSATYWQPIAMSHMPWIIAISLISLSQQYFVTKAFEKAPLTVIMPLQFVVLILVSIMAYLVFDELIDSWTLVGALLIFAGAIFHVFKSTKKMDAAATPQEVIVPVTPAPEKE